jgi:hypothetical protein
LSVIDPGIGPSRIGYECADRHEFAVWAKAGRTMRHLIDCKEDRILRALLVGMLREHDR